MKENPKRRSTQRHTLAEALFAVVLLLTACGGSTAPSVAAATNISSESFVPFSCPPESSYSRISDRSYSAFFGKLFSLSIDVDYFSVREVGYGYPEAERGEVCSGAQDVPTCKKRFDALIQNAAPTDTISRVKSKTPYVITIRGEEVKLWSPGEFTELLGRIDTPLEAWLVIRTRRDLGSHSCAAYYDQSTSDGIAGDSYRLVPGGFEIREQRYTRVCRPLENVETTLYIGEDGSVRVIDEHVAFSDPDRCVSN